MKSFVTFNQKNFVAISKEKNIKVDAVDAILFDWIQNFTKSQNALKKLIDNELYIWVSYKKIIDDNPICNLNSTDVVARRLKRLCDLGVLKKFVSKKDGNKVFFNITQYAYKYLLEGETLPTQKSIASDSKVETLPTQKSDNSKLRDRELNSNKKTNKKSNPLKEIIDIYKQSVSNLNGKIKEQRSFNLLTKLTPQELEELKKGLKAYGVEAKGTDSKYIKPLDKIIENKEYKDFKAVEKESLEGWTV